MALSLEEIGARSLEESEKIVVKSRQIIKLYFKRDYQIDCHIAMV